MLSSQSGTSVPKSYDSPPKAPNFKVKPRRKFPITAITVIHQAPGEWTVYFFRVGKNIRFFDTHLKRVEMLTNLMREFQNLNFVDISPDLMGWTAYVNQAVYPPPKVSHEFDYVLVRGQWFLHRNGIDATLNLSEAKRFETWEQANQRALYTNWQYCQIGELAFLEGGA